MQRLERKKWKKENKICYKWYSLTSQSHFVDFIIAIMGYGIEHYQIFLVGDEELSWLEA